LIVRPAQTSANRVRPDVAAGTIIGACILARYAGAFLLVYATLVIAAQSLRQRALALRRLGAMLAGVLPFVAAQGYINHVVAAGAVAPGGVTMSRDMLAMASARLGASITTFAAANHGVFFWMPNSLRWWASNAGEPAGLALACVVLLALPLVLMTAFRDRISRWPDDIRIVAAGMLIGLPVFLWVCGLVGSYVYIRDVRYYEELRPLAVCVALLVAAMGIVSAHRRLAAAVWLSRAYMLAFVLMTAVEVTAAFTPTAAGATWRRAMLGAEPRPWPSNQLTYESSEARRFVLALMNADPDAVLITTREQWFYADPRADRSRIMRWENCESLRATHISGPARFLILDAGRGDPGMRVQWPDVPSARRSCWPQMPGVEVIRQFPEEGLRVLRADVSEGAHIRFKHRIPTSE
jgi:hypothetical protein